MWAVQYRDGMTWETLQTHKFFLEAWLHLRWVQREASDVQVQIVRRFH